jgi:NitT/TauT family transport system substrate-binding protein
MIRWREILPVVAGLAALALTACGESSRPAAPPAAAPTAASAPAAREAGSAAYRPVPLSPVVPISVGTLASISDAGIFIGIERGYFQEEGLDVTAEVFTNPPDMIPALGTGRLDIATTSISAGLYNAIGRDVPLRIVADKGSTLGPEWDYVAMVVRQDLIDSGQVRDWPDLKGLTIAVSGRGASPELQVAHALAKSGYTLDDVDLTVLTFPDQLQALTQRSVDAANFVEPFVSRAVNLGAGVRWKGNWELFGGPKQSGIIIYGPRLVNERRDVGERWLTAYLRAIRDYNDAFGPKRQGRERLVEILIKHTAVKDPRDYEQMRPAGIHPDGKLGVDSMREDLAWYESAGYVREQIDLAQVVDTGFQEYAVRQLGPYER